tara:strand:+ start:551 stop:778 length:228 start_codon:yes stop_codon:yes gene_type:complete
VSKQANNQPTKERIIITMEDKISNALMNAYDIKKNHNFKKIKDKILNNESDSDYTIGDCIDDIINSLEQASERAD